VAIALRTAPPRKVSANLYLNGGQPAPLLDGAEAAFDDVAVAVVNGVERRRAPAARTAAFAVSLLIDGFRDDRDDVAAPQVTADRA
jgi:hypothetical protein